MGTEIAWTDETWNPTVGCSRVSPGCDNCYAIGVAHRAMQPAHVGLTYRPGERYEGDELVDEGGKPDWTGEVRLLPDRLDTPLRWRKPRRVFVDSMSDLFHPDVPYRFAREVFNTMRLCDGVVRAGDGYVYPSHTFQVLTKRPQRMREWASNGSLGFDPNHPPRNVWLGTSVENQRYADLRIRHLQYTPAAVRFLSVEPLLGPVNLLPYLRRLSPEGLAASEYEVDTSHRIGWVIIGGESGPGARPMEREWAQDIVDVCRQYDVPVFVKQLGTVLGGKHHQDVGTFPAGLQVREYPA